LPQPPCRKEGNEALKEDFLDSMTKKVTNSIK